MSRLLERNVLTIEKKKSIDIPKSMNLVKCWRMIGPVVAKEVAGPDYVHIPYLLDTEAYRIGHIFAQSGSKVDCCGRTPYLKVIGPIGNFVVKSDTDARWYANPFAAQKSTSDNPHLRVRLGHGKNQLSFAAWDYYFLSTPENMTVTKNVTIDRSSHEGKLDNSDTPSSANTCGISKKRRGGPRMTPTFGTSDLNNTRWFGLIREVAIAKIFELDITRKLRDRVFYVGESENAFLMKCEVCRLNDEGRVVDAVSFVHGDKCIGTVPVQLHQP